MTDTSWIMLVILGMMAAGLWFGVGGNTGGGTV